MSQNQSASSTQAPIVLNPQALLNAIHWLERAKQHTSELVDVFATHENDLKLVEIEIEITTALRVLSSGVKAPLPKPAFNSPITTQLKELLELAKSRAHELAQMPLYEQQRNAGLDFELAQVECPITDALAVLNNAVMQDETLTPAKPHHTVLLNEDGDDYHKINPCCTPPAGYRQVCIKCGFDSFDTGTFYLDCPTCRLQVVHYCRYVAIAGSN